jgi:hypothetical protein
MIARISYNNKNNNNDNDNNSIINFVQVQSS